MSEEIRETGTIRSAPASAWSGQRGSVESPEVRMGGRKTGRAGGSAAADVAASALPGGVWRRIRTLLLSGRRVTCGLSLLACAAPRDETRQPVQPAIVRDSAGLEIVEYASVAGLPTRLALRQEPFLTLGSSADVEQELDARQPWLGATHLAGGSLVVNERAALRFYSAEGALLRTVGRRGSGPGEFDQTREVCLAPVDTLLVIDYGSGRISVWDSAGHHVATYTRPGFIPLGGCFPDGTLLMRRPGALPAMGDSPQMDYLRVHRTGAVVSELGRLPSPQYIGPILREPSIVVTSSGVIVGDNVTFGAVFRDLSGRPRRVLRVLDRTHALTDDEWQRRLLSMLSVNASAAEKASLLQQFVGVKRPSTLPAFRRIRRDAVGRLWFEGYDDPSEVVVFDSTGRFLADLTLPRSGAMSASIAGLGRDFVAVRHTDTDGVVTLSFYRIVTR